MSNRKSTQVFSHVKDELIHAKKIIGLSNESQVIDYLYRFYIAKRGTISLVEHEKWLKEVEEAHKQMSF